MLNNIRDYIISNYNEAQKSILGDYNLADQKTFTHFDYINFHIVNSFILDERNSDLFIAIPQRYFRESFYESIFYSVVLIKLYQNYCAYQPEEVVLRNGDTIYSKGKLYIYRRRVDGRMAVELKFPKNNQTGEYHIDSPSYTKLTSDFPYHRDTTVKRLKGFCDFLNNKFGHQVPLLTHFPHKCLVIADQRYYKVNKDLPTRYWTKSGKQSQEIPIDTLIEVCNDFHTANHYILNGQQVFDEIIVIGDAKFADSGLFAQIQNAKWTGKVRRIILIGNKKPQIQHQFTEWLWSFKECRLANHEKLNIPSKVNIQNDNLLQALRSINMKIRDIHAQRGPDLAYLLRFVNFYLRFVLNQSPTGQAVLDGYMARLVHHFESEEFKLRFYEKDIYDEAEIVKAGKLLLAQFETLSDLFISENLKWQKIKEISNQHKQIFLITEKRNYDFVKKQINGNSRITLISDKRIDGQIPHLERWISDDQRNTAEKTYVIPYLQGQDQHAQLQGLNGKTHILCFKDVDEIWIDHIINKDYEDLLKKLNHPDRKKFLKTTFKYQVPKNEKDLAVLFDMDLPDQTQYSGAYLTEPSADHIYYKVSFEDGSTEVFKSSKAVFLIEANEQLKATIGEIYDGAVIRYYKNESYETFKQILSIFDTKSIMAQIDAAVKSWKAALTELRKIHPDAKSCYQEIYLDKKAVHFDTFQNYFDPGASIRFPRKHTLEAIKDCCIRFQLSDLDLVLNYHIILNYAKEDKRIRQQAGKILGADLIEYVASAYQEKSLSLKMLPDDTLTRIVKSIIEKKVVNKQLISNNEEHLYKPSAIDFS